MRTIRQRFAADLAVRAQIERIELFKAGMHICTKYKELVDEIIVTPHHADAILQREESLYIIWQYFSTIIAADTAGIYGDRGESLNFINTLCPQTIYIYLIDAYQVMRTVAKHIMTSRDHLYKIAPITKNTVHIYVSILPDIMYKFTFYKLSDVEFENGSDRAYSFKI
jgi:hypothetical protein